MDEGLNPTDAALRAALSRRRFLRGTAGGAATVGMFGSVNALIVQP